MRALGTCTTALLLLTGMASGCGGGGGSQGTTDAGDGGDVGDAGDGAMDAGDAAMDAGDAAMDAGDAGPGDAGDGAMDAGDAGDATLDASDAGDEGGTGDSGGAMECAGQTAGTPCRPAVDDCDLEEVCDGVSDTCPVDTFTPATTACDDGTFCNGAEMCDGAGTCVSSGDPCGGPDGDANCAETCDESADACTGADPDESPCAERACEQATCQAGACLVTTACPIFVDPAGSDGQGCGLAWGATACASVQGGSDEAVRSDVDRVWVREASYTSSDTSAPVLSMVDGLMYYGGFTGSETQEDDRDPATRSTLDGENAVVQVVIGASNARLDGFAVTGGNGTEGSAMYNDAVSALVVEQCDFVANTSMASGVDETMGSVSNRDCTDVTFRNVSVEGNAATATDNGAAAMGAGMANSSCTALLLEDVLFLDNQAAGASVGGGAFGGGLLNADSSVTLRRVRLEGNTVAADFANGAGLASYQSTLTLDDVQIVDNRVSSLSGGLNNGGGMFDELTRSTLQTVLFEGNGGSVVNGGGYAIVGEVATGVTCSMTDVTFVDNDVAGGGGGALFIESSGSMLEATLEGGVFEDNLALGSGASLAFGGAVGTVDADLTIRDAIFRGNTAEGADALGGAIQVFGGSLSLVDVDLLDNQASATAGVPTIAGGGAVDVLDANVTLTNVSMGNNLATGAGALGGALLLEGTTTAQVQSATFAENTATAGGALSLMDTATASLDNVVLGGNTPTDLSDPLGGITQGHLCAAGHTGDGAAFTDYTSALVQGPQDRWYLTAASVCIDSGDDASANAAFGGNTWQMLTTQVDGTLDTGTTDMGRHYVP